LIRPLTTHSAFQGGLNNGGPAGLIYGYIWTWFGTVLQVLVMSEMASMIPLSGGQYNWVAILCPPWCSKFFSYVTGWVTFVAWQAVLASAALLGGTMIQGLLILNYPDYVFYAWQGTLLFYAIVALALFVNTVLARLLPAIESGILVIHIVGFFGILIPLVYLAPHGSPSDVFTLFNNGGGWATDGLSFFVGETTVMFAFVGIDAAAHMGMLA
jgi:choline transport protein